MGSYTDSPFVEDALIARFDRPVKPPAWTNPGQIGARLLQRQVVGSPGTVAPCRSTRGSRHDRMPGVGTAGESSRPMIAVNDRGLVLAQDSSGAWIIQGAADGMTYA